MAWPTNERIRIAIVIDRIFRWSGAGTERHLAQLLEALNRDSYEVAVFTFEPSQNPFPTGLDIPIEVVPPGDPRHHFRLLKNLTAVLRRFRPHIVQTFFRDASYFGPVAARLASVPILVMSRRDTEEPTLWWESPVMRMLSWTADSWVCNGQSVRDWLVLKKLAKLQEVEVLPNCVDLDRFQPPSNASREAARMKLGLPADGPILVSVANLRAVKGLATIVQAASLVRTKLPAARFFLIGEGPGLAELTAQIESLGLSETVSLVGAQSDIVSWLAAADLGLLASYREGSSNALLEYLAAGLPSIVSEISANHELVDGLFFPAGNAEALAIQIVRVWNDAELRSQLGQDYRKRALAFSKTAFTEKVNRYYADLVDRCENIERVRVPAAGKSVTNG